MEKISLDKIEVLGSVVPEEKEGEFRVSFDVQGSNNYHLFSNLLKNKTFDIVVPSLGHQFKAKRLSSSSSYQSPLDENTDANFSFTYKEYNDKEEIKWDIFLGLTQTAMKNWVRTRAISELLMEKEIFTKEEYENKLALISKRDFAEMQAYILEGITKKDEKKEEDEV